MPKKRCGICLKLILSEETNIPSLPSEHHIETRHLLDDKEPTLGRDGTAHLPIYFCGEDCKKIRVKICQDIGIDPNRYSTEYDQEHRNVLFYRLRMYRKPVNAIIQEPDKSFSNPEILKNFLNPEIFRQFLNPYL